MVESQKDAPFKTVQVEALVRGFDFFLEVQCPARANLR
jgi:hypothetical protein